MSSCIPLFLFASSLFTLVSTSDQFWLTTVITDFKVRDQCSEFWNHSQACPAPLLRISTDINKPNQFASRAWPIKNILLNSTTESPSFVSQWHGSIDSVRVSAQVEGSNPLNPFGLVAKCDEGFHPKVIFNQASVNVMERLSTRIIVINSQCFTARILVKVDTECPYCPPPTTTPTTTTAPESFIYTHRGSISLCLLLVVLTILSISIFIFTLFKFLKRHRGFKPFPSSSLESGISTIAPLSNSTLISVEKKSEIVDFFSLMPPVIEYEDFDLDVSVDVQAMPRLGSLVYEYISENQLNVSISDPIFV